MKVNEIKVLIVEDEEAIRKFIRLNLSSAGFRVFEAETGERALELVEEIRPDIMVLDIMLPGIDGFEVCGRTREISPETIVIMLTARGQDMDKIMGLELGADDYMVKPFNPLELIARIRAIIRRTEGRGNQKSDEIVFDNLVLNVKSKKFYKDGREIELTPTEYSILKNFMENPGRALSRDEILNIVWGENYFGDVKTVDVHIRRLREKVEDNPSSPRYIETVWGLGYRWKERK